MSFLLNNTTTQQSQQSGSTSGASSGTSSSTPTFSPQLQAMMDSLLSYSSTSMTNPTQQLQPIQNAGLQDINQSFAAVPGQVSQQMAARGYGSSGAAGDAMYQANLARSGAVSTFQGTLAQDAINQQNFGATLGEQLLNAGKGSTTSTSGTVTGSSSSNGTSSTTQSGLGGILQSLSSLLMLGVNPSGGGSTAENDFDSAFEQAGNGSAPI